VYDALTSDRPYRKAMGHEEAKKIIVNGRGTQFDPDLVDAFVANEEVFDRIRLFYEFEDHPQTIEQLLEGSVRELPDLTEAVG
jgi:putative two-component system response regulator